MSLVPVSNPQDTSKNLATLLKAEAALLPQDWVELLANHPSRKQALYEQAAQAKAKRGGLGCLFFSLPFLAFVWIFSRNWSPIDFLVEQRYSDEGVFHFLLISYALVALIFILIRRRKGQVNTKPLDWARENLLQSVVLPLVYNLQEDLAPQAPLNLKLDVHAKEWLGAPIQVLPTAISSDRITLKTLNFLEAKMRLADGVLVQLSLSDLFWERTRTRRRRNPRKGNKVKYKRRLMRKMTLICDFPKSRFQPVDNSKVIDRGKSYRVRFGHKFEPGFKHSGFYLFNDFVYGKAEDTVMVCLRAMGGAYKQMRPLAKR